MVRKFLETLKPSSPTLNGRADTSAHPPSNPDGALIPQLPSFQLFGTVSNNVPFSYFTQASTTQSLRRSSPPLPSEPVFRSVARIPYAGNMTLKMQWQAVSRAENNAVRRENIYVSSLQEIARIVTLSDLKYGEFWESIPSHVCAILRWAHNMHSCPLGTGIDAAIESLVFQSYSLKAVSQGLHVTAAIDSVVRRSMGASPRHYPPWANVHTAALRVASFTGASSVTLQMFEAKYGGPCSDAMAAVEVLPVQHVDFDHTAQFVKFALLYAMAVHQRRAAFLEIGLGTGLTPVSSAASARTILPPQNNRSPC